MKSSKDKLFIFLSLGVAGCGLQSHNSDSMRVISNPGVNTPIVTQSGDSQKANQPATTKQINLTAAQNFTLYDAQDGKITLSKLMTKSKLLLFVTKDDCKDCDVEWIKKIPTQLQSCDAVKIIPRFHARSFAKDELAQFRIYRSNIVPTSVSKRFGAGLTASSGAFVVDSNSKIIASANKVSDLDNLIKACN